MKGMLLWLGLAWVLNAGAAPKSDWVHPPRSKEPGIEHRTFRSNAVRGEVGFNICLPPDYSRDPQRRFPVIYYLHGYDGNESSFLEYANFWRASLARSGATILVFVNGGGTSFFSDAPDGSVMGETVVKELVRHVDSQYRTMASPPSRSLHGYSMGGFGALKLAFKYPDLFGSVVAYGATLAGREEFEKNVGKVYRRMFGSAARFEANNPLSLAQKNAELIRGHVATMIVVGSKDEFLAANRALDRQLTASKVPHEYVELPGVKHAKEPLYEKAAARAFAFSARPRDQQHSATGKSAQ